MEQTTRFFVQFCCFYGSHFLYFIMNLARFITKIILQQKIFYFMTISDYSCYCSFEICTTIIFGNLTKSLMIFGWTAYSAWLVSSKNLRGCFKNVSSLHRETRKSSMTFGVVRSRLWIMDVLTTLKNLVSRKIFIFKFCFFAEVFM